MADDLTIVNGTNGQAISGWTSIRVTRSIDRMPNDFQISLTEYFVKDGSQIIITPGSSCQIKLGNDLVLTGYVDDYQASVDPESHTVTIVGRSMSEDLVDCSAEYPNAQFSNSTALQIAKQLASVYGITVSQAQGVGNNYTIPQFNLMYGETAVEIIERITRWNQLIYYDQPDGSVLLTQASTVTPTTSLVQGFNIQSASCRLSMKRYSDYICVAQTFVSMSDGESLNSGENNSVNEFWHVSDPTVAPRHRLKYIIVESGDVSTSSSPFPVTKLRSQWEANRRAGKDFEFRCVVDTWRDANGKLWEPNTLIYINYPALKIVNEIWLISEVIYMRDEQTGTTASIVLNPPRAFQPEPIIIQVQPFLEGHVADVTGVATVSGTSATPSVNINPTPTPAPAIDPNNIQMNASDLLPPEVSKNPLPMPAGSGK